MECFAGGRSKGNRNSGKNPENRFVASCKHIVFSKNRSKKRKRKRPRTIAIRRKIREEIEKALCLDDSPVRDLLETDENGVVSVSLASVIHLLKLDSNEYRRLSCEAVIGIGNFSSIFSVCGDTRDMLRIVLKVNDLNRDGTIVYVDNLPHRCGLASLERWASTFGTIVFVRPIFERTYKNSNILNNMSTSDTCAGWFFQCAFIKFLDEVTSCRFIEFHRLLRKKNAHKRRKQQRLRRIRQVAANKVKSSRFRNTRKKLRRKKRKSKQVEEKAESTSSEIVKMAATSFEGALMPANCPSHAAADENESNKIRHKRKRKMSFKQTRNNHSKKFRATDAEGTTEDLPKSVIRDIGTNVNERLLLKETGRSSKRKRVHRKKPSHGKTRSRVSHLKKYFYDMQVYSLSTFQKLRAKYLELQKQGMIRLKAKLKKDNVSKALPYLSKQERKKKRGRTKLIMGAVKLREEIESYRRFIPMQANWIAGNEQQTSRIF